MNVTRITDREAPYLAQIDGAADLPGAELGWLAARRADARAAFAAEGFPTLKTEAWKYTNLDRLVRTGFAPAAAPGTVEPGSLAPILLDGASRLVFVDGRFVSSLSDLAALPDGVCLVSLARLLDIDPELVEPQLGRIAQTAGAPLAALALALAADGAVLIVPRGVRLAAPVQLVHVATGGQANAAHHLRSLVVLEEGAEATLVETWLGRGGASWTNALTEIALGPAARLDHLAFTDQADGAYGTQRAALLVGRDAVYRGLAVIAGGGLVRSEAVARLAGEGAEAAIDGLMLGRDRRQMDCWTEIVHDAPHTNSRQLFKSALDDRSRAAFQGRIVVREGAQKIDAHQLNRNLLLSAGARADSKPELEILADDVKCSHGSTVGDLDRDALFYLRARGIPADRARALLVEAFVAELVERVPSAPVRDWLAARLDRWLAGEAERRAA